MRSRLNRQRLLSFGRLAAADPVGAHPEIGGQLLTVQIRSRVRARGNAFWPAVRDTEGEATSENTRATHTTLKFIFH